MTTAHAPFSFESHWLKARLGREHETMTSDVHGPDSRKVVCRGRLRSCCTSLTVHGHTGLLSRPRAVGVGMPAFEQERSRTGQAQIGPCRSGPPGTAPSYSVLRGSCLLSLPAFRRLFRLKKLSSFLLRLSSLNFSARASWRCSARQEESKLLSKE